MLESGFHNKVDIYPYKQSDDTFMANNGFFDKENIIKDIPCRIGASDDFNTAKIIFNSMVEANENDGIFDAQNGEFYTITNVKKVYSKDIAHHVTCFVKKSYEKADVLDG